MKLSISPQQIQKQILAPTMQQSIEVLLLPLVDLSIAIEQELQNNPLLEINEDREESSSSEEDENIAAKLDDLIHNTETFYFSNHNDDEILEENPIEKIISLEESLLQQLRVDFSDPLKIKIGELIIGDLDEDGYLKSSVAEIAQAVGIDDEVLVERVLKKIQNFEPLGIASRSLKECLSIQVKTLNHPKGKLISYMVNHYLDELGRKRFHVISKRLGIPIEYIKEIVEVISKLEPKPARNYRPLGNNTYIKPDIIIVQNKNGDYQIQLNDDGLPPLRINSFYRRMLNSNGLNSTEKEFIKEKLTNAISFIRSVDQRNKTIMKISEYVLEKQKGFFNDGHMSLTPMILKDVAEAIDRNESTISRAISGKYMDTPQGVFPLKFFFSQGISEDSTNGLVASRGIKEEIKELIESENKTSPLSDQDIVKHFKQKGTSVARRTITKYRQTLKILPSYLRKA